MIAAVFGEPAARPLAAALRVAGPSLQRLVVEPGPRPCAISAVSDVAPICGDWPVQGYECFARARLRPKKGAAEFRPQVDVKADALHDIAFAVVGRGCPYPTIGGPQ